MSWIFILFIQTAHAEYRAFELVIANAETGQERTVISNLDPWQYRTYYPIKPNESIRYTDTWMCRGNTSGKRFCPKPNAQE